jgi:hypothetical protein
MNIPAWLGPTIGVAVGWVLSLLTRHREEFWFGPKLVIDGQKVPGTKGDTPEKVYVRFRVRNTTERRVAKNCRAYLVELHKISNGKLTSENLITDSFQLSWAGYDFSPRDIPANVAQ